MASRSQGQPPAPSQHLMRRHPPPASIAATGTTLSATSEDVPGGAALHRGLESELNQSRDTELRRHLFHRAHGPRRPPGPGTSAASSTASTASARGVGGHVSGESDASNQGEIVVRDQNGTACAVTVPTLPPSASVHDGEAEDADEGDELRGREARLQELLARRPRQMASDQEVLDALRASLQGTVDSLKEDAWQFSGSI